MSDTIIRTEKLGRDFKTVTAVDDLSLEVPAGAVFGFLGPNGAGKTTTIRLLLGLLEPTRGRAEVLGRDVRARAGEVRALSGALLEQSGLYERLSAADNLEYYGRIWRLGDADRRARIRELLEHFGLWDRRGEQAGRWSRGMKQKLAVARALLHRPRLVFLDEPTAGLDPASRMDLWELIKELVDRGTTVLLTTQYLDEADRLADRIAVIDHGQLISEGSGEELKNRVGGSVVEMSVSEEERTRTLEALRGVAAGQPTYDEQRRKVFLPASDGSRTLMEALRRLDGAGITPEDVALHKPTLDDVFLALTGHVATSGNGQYSPASAREGTGPETGG
jgi:ABC-2 type transport system ATP-binding protein